jgi:hypothetical protein
MRLAQKDRTDLKAQIAEYLARGGNIARQDPQIVTKTIKRTTSLASRHLGKHDRMGRRV